MCLDSKLEQNKVKISCGLIKYNINEEQYRCMGSWYVLTACFVYLYSAIVCERTQGRDNQWRHLSSRLGSSRLLYDIGFAIFSWFFFSTFQERILRVANLVTIFSDP